jgi:hypothetical protein
MMQSRKDKIELLTSIANGTKSIEDLAETTIDIYVEDPEDENSLICRTESGIKRMTKEQFEKGLDRTKKTRDGKFMTLNLND